MRTLTCKEATVNQIYRTPRGFQVTFRGLRNGRYALERTDNGVTVFAGPDQVLVSSESVREETTEQTTSSELGLEW